LITGIPVAGNAVQPPRTGPNPPGHQPRRARPPALGTVPGASFAGAKPTGEASLRPKATPHPERGATRVAPVAASHEDTSPDTPPRRPAPCGAGQDGRTCPPRSHHNSLFTRQSANSPRSPRRSLSSPNAALGATPPHPSTGQAVLCRWWR